MPKYTKNLEFYPEPFWSLFDMMENGQTISLRFPDEKLCMNTRFAWYNFQKAVLAAIKAGDEFDEERQLKLTEQWRISKSYEAIIRHEPSGSLPEYVLRFRPRRVNDFHSAIHNAFELAEMDQTPEDLIKGLFDEADKGKKGKEGSELPPAFAGVQTAPSTPLLEDVAPSLFVQPPEFCVDTENCSYPYCDCGRGV